MKLKDRIVRPKAEEKARNTEVRGWTIRGGAIRRIQTVLLAPGIIPRAMTIAFDELRMNGWGGLFAAAAGLLRRFWSGSPPSYPRANDYEKRFVTIVILSKNRLDLIRPCIESIEENLSLKYPVEIIIGDTGSQDKDVLAFYEDAQRKFWNVKIKKLGGYYYSRNCNDLVRQEARGEYLILLNNDTLVKGNWIDHLIDPLADKNIGIVGGKLLYPDETIQHAGIELNEKNHFVHPYVKERKSLPEANYPALVPAVTFACAAMRHDVYDRFRLDERFKEEAQDSDCCLRMSEAGFKILYNPQAEIFHLECSSRDWRKGSRDRAALHKKWKDKIFKIARAPQRVPHHMDYYSNAMVVVRDDGIGDLLMGVSAFKNLRDHYPDRKLVLLTYERNMEMMEGFGIFDEILPIPDGMKYAPLPIPTRGTTVYNLIDLEMQFGPTLAKSKEANKINRHLAFARAMALDQKYQRLPMPEYPKAKESVLKILNDRHVDPRQNFVVLNFLATNPARSWWEPYYAEFIAAVEFMGFVPLILGPRNSIHFRGRKTVNLAGKTKTVTEYIEAVKLGKYVVSTDTSACHIAALTGIPFLAIFTGGILPQSRLSYYSKYEVSHPPDHLACYPCWDEGCRDASVRWNREPCRWMIKPEEVIRKFQNLVREHPAR